MFLIFSFTVTVLVCSGTRQQVLGICRLFELQINADLSVHKIQPWRLAFFALTWTICCVRNNAIFHQESFDEVGMFELFKFHFAWWARNAWGGNVPSVSNIFRASSFVAPVITFPIPRPNVAWRPPSQDIIKVNVDSSFSVESGSSRIDSVLRDHFGNIILYFGKYVSVESVVHVEILAIREGLLIAPTFRWANSSSFACEFDSSNVVNCYSNPSSSLWKFQRVIREVVSSFGLISHIRHSGNEAVDILACIESSGMRFIDFV